MLNDANFYRMQVNTERDIAFQDGYEQGRESYLPYVKELSQENELLQREVAQLRQEMAILVQELQ